MALFAAILFCFSLLSIVGLFVLKLWERQHKMLAPLWRRRLDGEAEHLKALADAAHVDLSKLPGIISHWAHVALHLIALAFARLAHGAGVRAHRLADAVSHKRNFERRQTRSEFLRKVSERKNDSDDSRLDTTR